MSNTSGARTSGNLPAKLNDDYGQDWARPRHKLAAAPLAPVVNSFASVITIISFISLSCHPRLGLVKGKYADFLLTAWDEWDEDEDSDNDRPGDETIALCLDHT